MEEEEIKTEILGGKNPEYGLVACIHGKEKCGYEAIQKLKQSDYEIKKPVKLIIANEKARKKGVRYTEKDLNRCFPGDKESDVYEERLAARVKEEIHGLKILDFHSTYSKPTPFAFFIEKEKLELVKSSGVERAVDISYMSETMLNYMRGITVECGYTGTKEAAETAYKVMINFLAAEGVIDEDFKRSDPDVYEIYGEARGEGYLFTKKNFQRIEKGEPYAYRESDGDQKIAEEDFIPILMSDNGYPHKVGYKGRKMKLNETESISQEQQ